MRTTDKPARGLSNEAIAAFHRDGVICVRQLYSPQWIRQISDFLDEIVSTPSPVFGPRPDTSFHSDLNCWLTHDAVRDFVLFGPSAHIAQQAFESKRVTFYYDQIFVKDKLSPLPTPWHHEFTFWPLAGTQIASLWTSVDPVDAAASALEFVAGSHLWPQRFRAIGTDGRDLSTGQGLEDLPDSDTLRQKYNIVSWDLQPGDALLFHALTVHGARGNHSPNTKRRAIATRWCGDDVTYNPVMATEIYRHDLKPGDPFCSAIFPQVLPEILPAQIGARMKGPLLPDPQLMGAVFERLAQLDRVPVPLDE